MCDEEAETREHFALRCRSLAGARAANSQVLSWAQCPPQDSDFDVLILTSPGVRKMTSTKRSWLASFP